MSIATEITALQNDKTAIASAITAKGGTVASGDGFDDFATDIGTIPSGGAETFTIASDFTATNEICYKVSICTELSNYISDWSDIVCIQQINPTNSYQKRYQIYGIYTDIEHLGFDGTALGIAHNTLTTWKCWGTNKWGTDIAYYYNPMYLCAGDTFQIVRL